MNPSRLAVNCFIDWLFNYYNLRLFLKQSKKKIPICQTNRSHWNIFSCLWDKIRQIRCVRLIIEIIIYSHIAISTNKINDPTLVILKNVSLLIPATAFPLRHHNLFDVSSIAWESNWKLFDKWLIVSIQMAICIDVLVRC